MYYRPTGWRILPEAATFYLGIINHPRKALVAARYVAIGPALTDFPDKIKKRVKH
jgi:hypothetical protein